MKNSLIIACFLFASFSKSSTQTIQFEGMEFEISNVKASVTELYGDRVLMVERDLNKLPFDAKRLEATVDEPTFVKLKHVNFEDGIIEVKVLSRIQNPSPFEFAQGFIGLAFRVNEDNSAYESIYLRPRVGRSDNQFARNKTVQYYAYPDYKFEKLRKETPGKYETAAPVDLNEWITMRLEVSGEKAYLFVNDTKYATFVVDKMKGKSSSGTIGLWVDIGTEGYFKDLKITPHRNPVKDLVKDWERAKAYTKEYLDAMPESGYAYKPTPEMRSFAQQMLHLTDANYNFAAAATGVKSPIAPGESEQSTNTSKENVTKLVLDGYDFVIHQINQMTPDQLHEPVQLFGQFDMTKGAALFKCFEHQTHHRAQTTVYLRLTGVKPPPEQLF